MEHKGKQFREKKGTIPTTLFLKSSKTPGLADGNLARWVRVPAAQAQGPGFRFQQPCRNHTGAMHTPVKRHRAMYTRVLPTLGCWSLLATSLAYGFAKATVSKE